MNSPAGFSNTFEQHSNKIKQEITSVENMLGYEDIFSTKPSMNSRPQARESISYNINDKMTQGESVPKKLMPEYYFKISSKRKKKMPFVLMSRLLSP